ncbi:MAG: hypothetical protein M1824_006058 [Vezdaea acicularis]|nr:MAG: hypothetical protein M1824_006058 [Vezdaea acicularis]
MESTRTYVDVWIGVVTFIPEVKDTDVAEAEEEKEPEVEEVTDEDTDVEEAALDDEEDIEAVGKKKRINGNVQMALPAALHVSEYALKASEELLPQAFEI